MSMSNDSGDKLCPRCGMIMEEHEINRATINGEPAHVSCTIDELDEAGMDDFHND